MNLQQLIKDNKPQTGGMRIPNERTNNKSIPRHIIMKTIPHDKDFR